MNNDRFKFRVWDKYAHETPAEQIQFLCFNGCLVDSDGCHHSPDDYIFEQCTGLRDINGYLIYEGDVVYDKIYENAFIISWDDDRTGYILSAHNTNHIDYLSKLLINRHQLEIIGNIHEQKDVE